MKKINYIANIRIPTEKAHGLQIMKMCEAFSLEGADVTLVVPGRKNVLSSEDPFEYYGVQKNFSIRILQSPDPTWALRLPLGWYIKLQGVLFVLTIWRKRKELFLKNDEVVYTRDAYLLPMLTYFISNIVLEIHDMPYRLTLLFHSLRRCKKIIAITKGLKDDLVAAGMPQGKIVVHPDAVDLSTFDGKASRESLRAELGLPESPIAMYTGHLYEWKGADLLAKAAQKVGERLNVVFVGGTARDLEAFRTAFGGTANVHIVGAVNHRLIPQYLHVADIAVLPNSAKFKISSKYTSPLKMFEYMAAGKVIVAARLPSLMEVLNEHNAYLVEPDDVDSLANALESALKNIDLSQKKALQAKHDVQNYSWRTRARLILNELY